MSRRSGKTTPLAPGRRKSKRLSPEQKEVVVQTFYSVGSARKTAQVLGVAVPTVTRIMREAEGNPQLQQARSRALDTLAGRSHDIATQVLDSITPTELETTQEIVYDRHGNVLRYVTRGPSLKDKAIAAAILMDKQGALLDAQRKLREHDGIDPGQRALLLPGSIDEARRMIAQKVRTLRIVDVEFDTGETGRRIKDQLIQRKITEQEISDADIDLTLVGGDPFDQ